MNISLLVAATAGPLSFLSPCVLPLVPSYLAFVAGASLSDLRRPGRAARRGPVPNAPGSNVGFSLVFVAMGAAVTVVGGWLLSYRGPRPVGVLGSVAVGVVFPQWRLERL